MSITKNQLIEDWTDTIKDIIIDVKEYQFKEDHSDDIQTEDFYEHVNEQLWQTIDGCQEVIYTHQAKQVVGALYIDIFDNDPMTGEQYSSWHHAAFSGIYEMINEEINIDDLINEYLEDLIAE